VVVVPADAAYAPDGTTGAVARLAPLLPYAMVVVAAFVPLAAGLYRLVSSAWSTLERTAFGVHRARPVSG
jgi:YidC/Oxa1 family membrane protein insertase